MTKKKSFLFLLSCFSFFSFNVFGGILDGGGADAVVCRDQLGMIKSVSLLDFWEAKHFYQLTIEEKKSPYLKQLVDQIKMRMKQIHFNKKKELQLRHDSMIFGSIESFQLGLNELIKNGHFIFKDTLPKIQDNLPLKISIPKHCQIEQLAHFQAINNKLVVTINRKLWQRLHPTHQAGLLLHELVYAGYKIPNESLYPSKKYPLLKSTSALTRYFIGLFFDKKTIFSPQKFPIPKDALHCFVNTMNVSHLSSSKKEQDKSMQTVFQDNFYSFYLIKEANKIVLMPDFFPAGILFGDTNFYSNNNIFFKNNTNPVYKKSYFLITERKATNLINLHKSIKKSGNIKFYHPLIKSSGFLKTLPFFCVKQSTVNEQ